MNLGINPTQTTKINNVDIYNPILPGQQTPVQNSSNSDKAKNTQPVTNQNVNQNKSLYTQDQLKSMGKMQDPVTGQLFDIPKLSDVLNTSQAGISTSDQIRNQQATDQQTKADQLKADQEQLTQLETQKKIQDLKDSLTQGTQKPTLPDYLSTYKSATTEPVVGGLSYNDLNTALTTNKAQQRDLQTQLLQYQQGLSGEGLPQGEIDAATSAKQKNMQLQLIQLQNQEANLTDQMNIASSYINNVMNFTGQDYQAALNDYNQTFTQNYQTQQLYNTQQDKQQTTAQAYLNSVANMISNSGVNWSNMDPTLKASVTQQELKAGWAPGTLEAFAQQNPSKKIIATVNGMDENGNNTVSFITQDQTTGEPVLYKTINTGTGVKSTSAVGSEDIQSIADAIEQGLQPPTLTGMYGKSAAIKAQLAKDGFNLSEATNEWNATQKWIASANSTTQLRLRQAIGSVMGQIDQLTTLNDEWNRTGLTPINSVIIKSAMTGALGTDAQNIATQFQQQISLMTDELGQTFMGGNSPTDRALSLAGQMISSSWSQTQLQSALDNIKVNLGYRLNSIENTGAIIPGGGSAPDYSVGTNTESNLSDQDAYNLYLQMTGNQ